jgi:hypothetical protein
MIIESLRTVLDAQNTKGISTGDIINMLVGSPVSEHSFECGTITFYGDNHNPTVARLVKDDKNNIVEVHVAHNGKPLTSENDPYHLFSAQLESLRSCRQVELRDALIEYVKDIVERAIIEAILYGVLSEAEFHSYTPRYQLHNNRGETERLLRVAKDALESLSMDYVRFTDRLNYNTEEVFDILFKTVDELKKNVLILPKN